MSPIRFPFAIALTMLLTLLGNAAASAPVRLFASDEKMIRDLETNSWVAWKGHDAAFFEHFLSKDHIEIHPTGIVGKAAVVEGVRSPICVVQSYALGPLTLTRVSADTVVVTYRAEQDTKCGTASVPSPVWAASLYVKRAGRWENVLYQHTPVG
jgi:Domain of unknown function (DUF4440)